MVLDTTRPITITDFEQFVALPENSEKRFEFVNEEIIEVPSNAFVSKIAMLIGAAILFYLRQNNIGHVTGEGGGYRVNGQIVAPDVAYISYARQRHLADEGFNPNPPDLAIEVISNPDNATEQRTLRLKLTHYLAAGVIVWVVNAREQIVEVHQAGIGAQSYTINGILTAETLLPGFALPVRDIFPNVPADDTAQPETT